MEPKKRSVGAAQRNEFLRAAWRVTLAQHIDPWRLVFVDEMGANTSLSPISMPIHPRGRGRTARLRATVGLTLLFGGRGQSTTLHRGVYLTRGDCRAEAPSATDLSRSAMRNIHPRITPQDHCEKDVGAHLPRDEGPHHAQNPGCKRVPTVASPQRIPARLSSLWDAIRDRA
jgi:hypothetical protein